MTRQQYRTVDAARLWVETPAESWNVNRFPNPVADGAWGWTSDRGVMAASGGAFTYTSNAGGTNRWTSEHIPVEYGTHAAVCWVQQATVRTVRARLEWIDGRGFVTSVTPWTTYSAGSSLIRRIAAVAMPTSTIAMRLVLELGTSSSTFPNTAGGHTYAFRNVVVMTGAAAEVAAMNNATPSLVPLPGWTDILPDASSVRVVRDELNVGTLEVVCTESLDLATVRVGRRIRLASAAGQNIATARIRDSRSTREETKRGFVRVVRISATDAATDLAAETRPDGVGRLLDLPRALEGCGVPWRVNGSGDQRVGLVRYTSASASALDQVIVARDSSLGYAWVDRHGVLQAWDLGRVSGEAGYLTGDFAGRDSVSGWTATANGFGYDAAQDAASLALVDAGTLGEAFGPQALSAQPVTPGETITVGAELALHPDFLGSVPEAPPESRQYLTGGGWYTTAGVGATSAGSVSGTDPLTVSHDNVGSIGLHRPFHVEHDTFALGGWINLPAGGTADMSLVWYNAAGSYIGYASTSVTNTGWYAFGISGEQGRAPAGAVGGEIVINLPAGKTNGVQLNGMSLVGTGPRDAGPAPERPALVPRLGIRFFDELGQTLSTVGVDLAGITEATFRTRSTSTVVPPGAAYASAIVGGYARYGVDVLLIRRVTLASSGGTLPPIPVTTRTLTDVNTTNIDVGDGTARLINSATVTLLQGTEQLVSGPWARGDSVARHGPRRAAFTVATWATGSDPYAWVTTFTQAIFDAAGDLDWEPTAARITLATVADVNARAHVDLYDRFHVISEIHEVAATVRVVRIEHNITPDRWTVDYGFAPDTTVALPTVAASSGRS